ncbi:MAG TPA: response regulator [Pseudomonadales bacterium]|nr:response regulator [Pseudomonadales bacterium]
MDTEKKKVLIVDDNKTYLRFAEAALQSAGFHVLTSENIWISHLVASQKPQLILMDVTIGSANGTSAVIAIKKRSFGQGIKIVLHSSESDAKLKVLSRDCNADGYVSKDGNEVNLVNSVKRFLAKAG